MFGLCHSQLHVLIEANFKPTSLVDVSVPVCRQIVVSMCSVGLCMCSTSTSWPTSKNIICLCTLATLTIYTHCAVSLRPTLSSVGCTGPAAICTSDSDCCSGVCQSDAGAQNKGLCECWVQVEKYYQHVCERPAPHSYWYGHPSSSFVWTCTELQIDATCLRCVVHE